MRGVKQWLLAFLSGLQAILFAAPFVIDYYGSHRMGAHRHLKVRGDQYRAAQLNDANLAIYAVVLAVVFLLLLWCFFCLKKRKPQATALRSMLFSLVLTILLVLVLVLPQVKALLIFPWLLLCAGIIWLLQLVKAFSNAHPYLSNQK